MSDSPLSRRAFLQLSAAGIAGGAAFFTGACGTTNASDQVAQRKLLRELRAKKIYKEKEIEVGDNYFSPKETSVDAGTIVIWTNKGNMLHDVVPDDSHDSVDPDSFQSGNLKSRYIHVFLFEKPGTYFYHCHFHGGPQRGQWGSLTVKEVALPEESTTTTTVVASTISMEDSIDRIP